MSKKVAPPLVAVLIYDDLCTFEYGCAVEIFALSRPELGDPLYRCVTFACTKSPVRALGGVSVTAEHGLEVLRKADTIIIPGWRRDQTANSKRLIKALQTAHSRGARIASICSGVYLLAEAGLLNQRHATTHWKDLEKFSAEYPEVTIEPNVLYVDEDRILTSAGSAAGLDLCMHMVRCDYGAEVANTIARRLVLPPHREGGQAQYVPAPVVPLSRHNKLSGLLEQLRAHLEKPHSVSSMANTLGMSERSLLRRFKEATGMAPLEWLTAERIRRARDLLETTSLPVDRISESCGFGSVESFRVHFRKLAFTSPSQYRKQFARSA